MYFVPHLLYLITSHIILLSCYDVTLSDIVMIHLFQLYLTLFFLNGLHFLILVHVQSLDNVNQRILHCWCPLPSLLFLSLYFTYILPSRSSNSLSIFINFNFKFKFNSSSVHFLKKKLPLLISLNLCECNFLSLFD